jgi:ribose transport system permease protein
MTVLTEHAPQPQQQPRDGKASARRFRLNQTGVIWLLLLLAVPASRLVSPEFPSGGQVRDILVLGAFLAVVAFGQGLVVLSGGLDLSVSALVTAAGVFAAAHVQNGGSLLSGILLAVLLSAGLGAVSGIGVAYLRIPPFIMTVAAGSVVSGALLGLNRSQPTRPAPAGLQNFFGGGSTVGVPNIIWFLVGFVVIATVVQQVSTYGRRVYLVGNGEVVARMSGVPVRAVTASVYAVAGACYGIAALMLVGYASGANLSLGADYLLPSIAAVVVGGTAISGGRGSYLGTVAGALLLTTVAIDISATSLGEGWKNVLYGAIVLAALLLSNTRVLSTVLARRGR